MSTLEIFLFGTPHALLDGHQLETDRRKAVALLSYLAIEPQNHPREEVATLLWPDFERASALAYLRRTLWELNNFLGKEWLETDRQSVHLRRDQPFWLDTQHFQQLIQEYRTQPSTGTANRSLLEEAVQLYKADFLSGFSIQDSAPFEDWQRLQGATLQRECRWALAQLASDQERLGDFEAALSTAHRWLALDDLNEAAHRALIRLYAAQGDRTSAVRQYEFLTQKLLDELAAVPQQETVDLYQDILSGRLAAAAPLVTIDTKHDNQRPDPVQEKLNLPRFPTPFIGRRPEVEQITGLLSQHQTQLLTLLGPGGSGKTRLAVQAAAELVDKYPDGVWFVPLAPLQDSSSMIPAVAKTLEFSFYRAEERPRQQLLNYLREQKMLLILDNFEHLQDAESVGLIREILERAANLEIMITSRSRLNISGEQLIPVAGMKMPDQAALEQWQDPAREANAFSSLMLFRDRAARIKPGFQITQDNLSDIVNICHLVEGMPLGIELAASWLELLPPQEILTEIKRSLDFLETEVSDIPGRQRSIRVVFDASWALLTADERDVAMRLSIFPGTISRPAAEEVGQSSLRTLLSLVNKSWLQPLKDGRYQIHELLRQYTHERLQQDIFLLQNTHDEQVRYYGTLLQSLVNPLRLSGQKEALDQIGMEFENIRAAWEWALRRADTDYLVENYLDALYHFADMRMAGAELIPMLDKALAQLSADDLQAQDVLINWAKISILKIHCLDQEWLFHDANTIGRQIFSLLSNTIDPDQLGYWYYVLLFHYAWGVDLQSSIKRFEERLPLLYSGSDQWLLANVLLIYGNLFYHGSRQEALALYEEALPLMQSVGDLYGLAQIYSALGSAEWSLVWKETEPSLAIPHLQKAREICAAIGVKGYQEGQYYRELGEFSISQGKIERAFDYFEQEIQIHKQRGNRRLVINCLHWTSMQAVRYKDIEFALKLREECQQVLRDYHDPFQQAFSTWEMGELQRVAGNIEQAKVWYQEANTLFEALHDKLGMGYFHRGLGDIALSMSDYQEARNRFDTFYDQVKTHQSAWHVAYAHTGLGRAALGLGFVEDAHEHFRKALYTSYEIISVPDICMLPICGFAHLLLLAGKNKEAAAFSSFVAGHNLTWNEIKKRAAAIMDRAVAELSTAEAQKAQEKGQSWHLVEVIESLLDGGLFTA